MKPDLFLKSTIAVITATAEARVRSDGSIENRNSSIFNSSAAILTQTPVVG